MASKLSVYLVQTRRADSDSSTLSMDTLDLVIAESASRAQDVVVTAHEYRREIVNVGRLGEFDPGDEGHAMIVQHTQRGIVRHMLDVTSPRAL